MKKRTWIRIGIIIAIIALISFSDRSFAAEAMDNRSEFLSPARTIKFVVDTLSWLWIIFAKLAGELLTNKWVYGEIIGLDSLLWQYRNVTKNIANFCLGFYFVYVICAGIIKQEDLYKKMKQILLWLLVAGVGVQASRFFTAAIIDISTITLSVAGSFPSQVISTDQKLYESVRGPLLNKIKGNGEGVGTGETYVLFPNNSRANSFTNTLPFKLKTGLTNQELVDSILPTTEDVGGPLYYMGYMIINTSNINSLDTSTENAIKKGLLNLIIQGGTTIVYSIEMFVLCILALMRIIYLWMFIVLSPIVVLIRCIKQSGEQLGGNGGFAFIKSFEEQLNFKSFFTNVFKPTLIVFMIGLSLIFASLIKEIVITNDGKDVDIGGVKISSYKDAGENSNADETYTTSITSESGFLNYTFTHAGKGILDFLLSLLTVILVYFAVKIAVTMGGGSDFVSSKIKNLQTGIGNAIASVPIIPVTGYDDKGVPKTSYISAGSAFGLGGKESIASQYLSNVTGKVTKKSTEQTDDVMRMWGLIDENSLDETMKLNIRSAGEHNNLTGLEILGAKRDYINSIKTEKGRGLTLNPTAGDKFWQEEFANWLTAMENETIRNGPYASEWNSMIQRWKEHKDDNDRTLESLFSKNNRFVIAYAKFFKLKGVVDNWTDLIKKDISSQEDTEGGTNSSTQEKSSESNQGENVNQTNPPDSGQADTSSQAGQTS